MYQMTKTMAAAVAIATAAIPAAAADQAGGAPSVERGRYLVKIAGCNDCHTVGYPEAGGKVEEKQWLTGSPVGWNGPWGTTYASNLRLYFQGLTEAQWMKAARTMESRPPMPWFNLRAMNDADLRAIYRYVRSLGPAGEPAKTYLPPDKAPSAPYFRMTP